jgi:hypothetical protein
MKTILELVLLIPTALGAAAFVHYIAIELTRIVGWSRIVGRAARH